MLYPIPGRVVAGLERFKGRLNAFNISVAVFPGNGIQLGLQSTDVALLDICGTVTGAGVKIENSACKAQLTAWRIRVEQPGT